MRRLEPDDVDAYRALMLEAYAQHPEAYTSSAAERAALPMSWWAARLLAGANPSKLVLGAFINGQLAGVAGVSFEQREKVRHKANLFGMYVRAQHRHAGTGGALLKAALAEARGRVGVRLMQLSVSEGNTSAQALYERHGFVRFGTEPLAVAMGASFIAKLHLWCDLQPLPA